MSPGDPPGFPVVIDRPGSYVLTSDLAVLDPGVFVLDIRADDVSIDLNGFTLRGPQTCGARGCGSTGFGHAIASFNVSPIPANTTVRNGELPPWARSS